VRELDVGPKWIPRKKLTVGKLAAAIQQAVNDSAMIQHAEELGQRIRAEDGIRTGVQLGVFVRD
jgi:sterol 3beta-glucosyltransferase